MRKRRSNVVVLGTAEVTNAPIVVSPTILAFPVVARRIDVIGPTSELWGLDGPSLKSVVKAGMAVFVWLDPPFGVDATVVETALREVGCAVGRRPKMVTDATIAEDIAAAPAAVTQTIREVVAELVSEVRTPLTDEDRGYLTDVLDTALSGVGL